LGGRKAEYVLGAAVDIEDGYVVFGGQGNGELNGIGAGLRDFMTLDALADGKHIRDRGAPLFVRTDECHG
jgi:hypothetical protein